MISVGYLGRIGLPASSSSSRRLLTPASLGASIWLTAKDASSIIVSGSTISQWSDKSGNGNHLVNSTGATQPAYLATEFNGLPTVRFAFSRQDILFCQNAVGLSSASDFLIAAVFEFRVAVRAWDVVCGFRSAANTSTPGAPLLQGMLFDEQIGIHNTDRDDTRIKVDVTTRRVKRIVTVGRSGGTNGNGGTVTITATGPSQASYLTTGTQSWNSTATNGFQLGGRQLNSGSVSFGDKDISEIICLPYSPNTALRQQIEGYLAHEWGLSSALPSDHPFRNSPPYL
jgi:hypothetical protein